MHIFLTGERDIGKSRTAAAAAALLRRSCVGFRTVFTGEDRRASDLYLCPADADDPCANGRPAAVWRDGKLTAVGAVFDTWGTELLRRARQQPDALILMDECGHVEKNARVFQREILACLDGDAPVLGVLRKNQAWHEIIKNHPKVRVIEVTEQNREMLPRQVANLLLEEYTPKGIMRETVLPWSLNGEMQPPFLCSEGDAEALMLGHMVASGLVDAPENVRSIRFDDGTWQVQAELSERARWPAFQRLEALDPLPEGFTAKASEIICCSEQVMALDHGTGLHAILLGDGEKTALGRDIGRHNALEKAVGTAIRNGLSPAHMVLASSGRLSLEMLSKAAFAGIPILVTQKQAGSLCLKHARRLNMTVCRLEAALYPLSHPERLGD